VVVEDSLQARAKCGIVEADLYSTLEMTETVTATCIARHHTALPSDA
jgi:hypothetical protein